MKRYNWHKPASLLTILWVLHIFPHIQDYNYAQNMIIDEKPIVVVIPSFNNRQWYKRNLDSVFSQKYHNFRVIYIDDVSPDGTYQLVKAYVEQCGQQDRVILKRNLVRQGALANLYYAIHACPSRAIIITLDGDDWFKHDQVLATINRAYDNPNVWMTYGQFEEYPEGRIGFNQPMPDGVIQLNVFREFNWITSHLRTFYAGLFHKIKLEDLIYRGRFFQVTWDQAFMLPMLEMSAGRWKFISDVLYVYNQDNPINDYKVNAAEQIHCEKVIRSKTKYQCLAAAHPFDSDDYSHEKVDLLILSHDKPAYLSMLLQTVNRFMHGLENIVVLYATSELIETTYEKVQTEFPSVRFVKIALQDDTKALTKQIIEQLKCSTSSYVMFAHDQLLVKDEVNVSECIHALERTGAFGFYLTMGNHINAHDGLERPMQMPPAIKVKNDIWAWQFKDGEFDWRKPQNINMTLYRKSDITYALEYLSFDSAQMLESLLAQQQFDLNKVGLFFESSKIVCLDEPAHIKNHTPMSLKHEIKIDLERIAKIKNESVALSIQPFFITQSNAA